MIRESSLQSVLIKAGSKSHKWESQLLCQETDVVRQSSLKTPQRPIHVSTHTYTHTHTHIHTHTHTHTHTDKRGHISNKSNSRWFYSSRERCEKETSKMQRFPFHEKVVDI